MAGKPYTVKQGDYLAKIAKEQGGFDDWRMVWDDPANADLKQRRNNDPNILYPGDVVFIPEKERKTETGATELVHRFRLRSQKLMLRLRVLDVADQPYANMPYELVVPGRPPYEGVTKPDGTLEHEIPLKTAQATLTLDGQEWPLNVGALHPLEKETTPDQGVSGAQARLANLGFDPGPSDGVLGPRTEAAVRAFQRKCQQEGLQETGKLDDATHSKLKEKHGC